MTNMTKKRLKTIFRLIVLVFIFIILYKVIFSTYSRYLNVNEVTYSYNTKNWSIKINDIDLNANLTNIINSITEPHIIDLTNDVTITWNENKNISQNVIVPGIKGYIDLTLDYEGTTVPFTYYIRTNYFKENDYPSDSNIVNVLNQLKTQTQATIPDYNVTGYKVDDDILDDTIDKKSITDNLIQDSITPDSITTTRKIRIYVEWIDMSTTSITENTTNTISNTITNQVMNNWEDTQVALNSDITSASIPVNIKVIEDIPTF